MFSLRNEADSTLGSKPPFLEMDTSEGGPLCSDPVCSDPVGEEIFKRKKGTVASTDASLLRETRVKPAKRARLGDENGKAPFQDDQGTLLADVLGERSDALAASFFKKRRGDAAGSIALCKQSDCIDSTAFPSLKEKEYAFDAPPYILTTEIGQEALLSQLKSVPKKENGCLLGFAFDFNYSLILERSHAFAVICDVNQRMHALYQFVEKTVQSSPTREAFIKAFKAELQKESGYYFGLQSMTLDHIFNYFQNTQFCWLASDTQFEQVKRLYQEGKVKHLNLNLSGDQAFYPQLMKWAKANQLFFDTVYVSNIPEWLYREGGRRLDQMRSNLLEVMTPETLLIDAKQQEFERGEPVLRLSTSIRDEDDFPSFRPTPRRKSYVRERVGPGERAAAHLLLQRPTQDSKAEKAEWKGKRLFD